MMKSLLVSAALAAVLTACAAFAQPPEAPVVTDGSAPVEELAQPSQATEVDTSRNSLEVTVDKTVEVTPSATVETTTETIVPVSNRPDLDPTNPIAPEVQAVVEAKRNYTTADLANAQLAAVLATPPSQPTTIITTTRTTPKEGG